MPLEEYRRKRDFSATPEPAGDTGRGIDRGGPADGGAGDGSADGGPADGGLVYVIQRHAARQLHHDFRIELGGVLVSWAVPKGPSLDPAQKRLAMRVEDHPLDYATFEGVIPEGEYGGGTVMLWDRGTWEPYQGDEEQAAADLAAGHLKMVLHGERLRGRWVLVRTRGYGGKRSGESWLLIKEHDGAERPASEFDAVAEWTTSVATGRTMEQIASDAEAVWHTDPATAEDTPASPPPSALPGAHRGELPHDQRVQLATLVKAAPATDEWLHEIKLDGYRILARAHRGDVRLISRNGKDWTERFARVASAVQAITGERDALIDGEVVVLDDEGVSDFQALQDLARTGDQPRLHYFAFDLLHLDGWDLRACALEDRKRALAGLLGEARGTVRYTDHVIGRGERFFAEACSAGLEGIVSKRRDSTYAGGRQRTWLKTKCLVRQEFAVVGYTDPGGSRPGFGALVLAVCDGGAYRHVGRVGTGFSEAQLADIMDRLRGTERDDPTVVNPPKGAAARGLHWVEPALVAEVAFTEWTADGQLRHPSFLGLRDDKAACDAERETALAAPDAAAGTAAPPPEAEAPGADAAPPKHVAGVPVTNPERVLWPDAGVTKLDLMRHYERVAELMLPHVAGRPLSLVRCPEGLTGECFYQKRIANFPDAVGTVGVFDAEEGREVPYARVDDLAGLVGLAQMGVVEIHPWGSRADDIEKPDRLTFDLDPDDALPYATIVATALLLRSELSRLGLESWVKSTGGKGLHVVVPVLRRHTWDEVREFAHAFVDSIVALEPALFTANMRKARRSGRIFIDYLRNSRGATAIAPYSTRARPGAPVAVPLAWEELESLDGPPSFDVRTLPSRIGAAGFEDPWRDMGRVRQSITKLARSRLASP